MFSILAKLEALIYAAEEPVSVDQIAALLKDDLLALKSQAAEAQAEPSPEPAQTTLELSGAAASEDGVDGTAPANAEPAASGTPESTVPSTKEDQASAKRAKEKAEKAELRALLTPILDQLVAEYADEKRGVEIRQVAGGYRMSTKPEHHDIVKAFAKSLKPPIRFSLQALETLAVIAYKQPITVPEISEIRGVDAGGVIGTLIERKLITTAGRKAVVGRPMLYKTTKEFLLRFGLKDLQELPSVEEFEKLISAEQQEEAVAEAGSGVADATGVPEVPEVSEDSSAQKAPQSASEEQAVRELTEPSEPAASTETDDAAEVSQQPEGQEVQHDAAAEPASAEQAVAEHTEPVESAETTEPTMHVEASDSTAENSESGDSGSEEDREIQLNADMEPTDPEAEEQPKPLERTELPAEHDVQHNASTEPMDEEQTGKEHAVSAEAFDGDDTEGHN
jgi:segregation and condensation protein B